MMYAIFTTCAIFVFKKLLELRLRHWPLIITICYVVCHQYNPMILGIAKPFECYIFRFLALFYIVLIK